MMKLKPRQGKLWWESVRGWEERFTTEIWTRGAVGGAERLEFRRDEYFLSRIALSRADWNST